MICGYGPSQYGYVGACGMFQQGNAAFCPLDVSLAFDGPFLNGIVARHGRFAAMAVIGHEWGHFNQYRLNLLGNGSSYEVNFRNERQADCQAGIFAAYLQSQGTIVMSDANGAYMQFCEAGVPWFDPSGHGDCPTRAGAFAQGYEGAMSNLTSFCSGTPDERRQAMLTVCPW